MSHALLEETTDISGFGAVFGSARGSGHLSIVPDRELLMDSEYAGLERRKKLVGLLKREVGNGDFDSVLTILNDTAGTGDKFAAFPEDVYALLTDIIALHNKRRLVNVVTVVDEMWEKICTPEMADLKHNFQEKLFARIGRQDRGDLGRSLRSGNLNGDIFSVLPVLEFEEMARQAQHLEFTSELNAFRDIAGNFLDQHGAKVIKSFGMDHLLNENDRWQDDAQWHDIAEKFWEAVATVNTPSPTGRPKLIIERAETADQIKFWFGG